MALTLITPPGAEPVTLAEAKAHLRVDTADEDALINGLITAAREWAEAVQSRVYITQTWELVLDAFPESEAIKIPFPPLQSVDSISYKDEDGNPFTFAASNYIVDSDNEPGRVVLAANASWPSAALYPASAMRVRFIAGYGAITDVPQKTKQAILLLLGHLHEHREAVIPDIRLKIVPMGAKVLLGHERIVKV